MPDLIPTIFSILYALTLLIAVVAIGYRFLRRDRTGPGIGAPAMPDEQTGEIAGFPEPPPILPGKVKTAFYRRGDLMGISLLYLLFVNASLGSLKSQQGTDLSAITASQLFVGMLIQLIIPAVVVVAAMRLTSLNEWLGLRWRQWREALWIAPVSVILLAAIFYGIDSIGYREWLESLGVETKQDTVALLENTRDPAVLGMMIIAAVVMAPLWEELVFRGYLYPVLKKYGGIWVAALCSSLLFAAIHNSLVSILPLFLLALMMVWLYERSGSIWMPIAIHACFNGLSVLGILAVRNQNANSAILLEWLPFLPY
ncbi:MAG: type II CAAX endopeptidase family protein [Akkermansiaceae bacterium]|nr:type II CAAX endopeptidase family protein [Akkermansiaceae bacterium]